MDSLKKKRAQANFFKTYNFFFFDSLSRLFFFCHLAQVVPPVERNMLADLEAPSVSWHFLIFVLLVAAT